MPPDSNNNATSDNEAKEKKRHAFCFLVVFIPLIWLWRAICNKDDAHFVAEVGARRDGRRDGRDALGRSDGVARDTGHQCEAFFEDHGRWTLSPTLTRLYRLAGRLWTFVPLPSGSVEYTFRRCGHEITSPLLASL